MAKQDRKPAASLPVFQTESVLKYWFEFISIFFILQRILTCMNLCWCFTKAALNTPGGA